MTRPQTRFSHDLRLGYASGTRSWGEGPNANRFAVQTRLRSIDAATIPPEGQTCAPPRT